MQTNRFFKEKSLFLVLREVGWVPDRIPDKDIKPNSTLGMLRLIQTKRVTDPVTGQQKLENTDIVKRARKVGYSDDFIMHTAPGLENVLERMNGGRFSAEAAKAGGAPEGYKTFTNEHLQQQNSMVPNDMHGKKTLPELLKYDLNNDVCGKAAPLSSLNYVAATMQIMMMFTKIEEELRRVGNPSYLAVYTRDPVLMREKRLSLTQLALEGIDEECLRVMAAAFEKLRCGFMDLIYWKDLDDAKKVQSKRDPLDFPGGSACTIM